MSIGNFTIFRPFASDELILSKFSAVVTTLVQLMPRAMVLVGEVQGDTGGLTN